MTHTLGEGVTRLLVGMACSLIMLLKTAHGPALRSCVFLELFFFLMLTTGN